MIYEREYYETHEGIRITINQNIQFSDAQLYTKLNKNIFVPYSFKVLEIKFNPEMKIKISELIKSLHLTPKRHSKYLVGVAMLGYKFF